MDFFERKREFYKRHPHLKLYLLMGYELAIGLMLYLALSYANQAFAMGAHDCYDYWNRMANDSHFFVNMTNFTFKTNIPSVIP